MRLLKKLQRRLGQPATVNSLDTNVILRYMLNDDPVLSKRARGFIVNNKSYVTDVIVTEIATVLDKVYEIDKADIAELIQAFLGLENVTYNLYFLDAVIELYEAKPALSFVDCYATVEARMYANTLVTFDKKLINQGGKHVVEPE